KPVDRSTLGLSGDDLVLINVGSLEPRKNQIGLLDLFECVARDHGKARLLLVGDGPQRREIERKIHQRQLADRVGLLGHRRDVPALLNLADVYVHYARLESCPMVLLEAARAARPWAAIPAGGIGELQSRLGGVALDEDDPAASL